MTRLHGGVGAVMGTGELVSNTIAATMGSINKVTQTIGDGFSSLSMDQKYSEKWKKIQ